MGITEYLKDSQSSRSKDLNLILAINSERKEREKEVKIKGMKLFYFRERTMLMNLPVGGNNRFEQIAKAYLHRQKAESGCL